MDLINMILLGLNLLFFISTRLYIKDLWKHFESVREYSHSVTKQYHEIKHENEMILSLHNELMDQYTTLTKLYECHTEIINHLTRS